jgi:hypothetical protein
MDAQLEISFRRGEEDYSLLFFRSLPRGIELVSISKLDRGGTYEQGVHICFVYFLPLQSHLSSLAAGSQFYSAIAESLFFCC